jgi:hypothetical protein
VRTRSVALRSLLAVVPVGLLLAGSLVWQSTAAAFTATTDNTGNTWQAGSVTLTDSDAGSALFDSAANGALRPGSNRSRCIRVDYTGDLTADIRLSVTTPTAGAVTLDNYLMMSVERGRDVAAGTVVNPDCSTGFTSNTTPTFLYNTASATTGTADQTKTLGALKTAAPDYANGLRAGTSVAGGTSLTFRIGYWVLDDNAAQSKRSTATFTWEARNVP